MKKKIKTFFKCNWVTGSPPKFDTLWASWYLTYMQSFIISHSSCAEKYGDMSSDTQTHSPTIKLPTAGVRQLGHTSIIPILLAYTIIPILLADTIRQRYRINQAAIGPCEDQLLVKSKKLRWNGHVVRSQWLPKKNLQGTMRE